MGLQIVRDNPGVRTPPAVPRLGYELRPVSSADLEAGDYSLSWLAEGVLAEGQPAVIGGPKKCMKTSLLVDLGVSLASGTPFLNSFAVPRRFRTLLISGESGEHTLQETCRRVRRARGLGVAEVGNLFWDFRLPRLARYDDVEALGRGLRALGAEVVAVDPLYLCLLSGHRAKGLSAANLFDVGPLLLDVSDVCRDAGCTLLFAHHARKAGGRGRRPLDLDDLSFAGVGEFARQWILLSRREPYRPGSGSHKVWLSAGASAGHGGTWDLDVEEGARGAGLADRRWEVSVRPSFGDGEAAAVAKPRASGWGAGNRQAEVLEAVWRLAPGHGGVAPQPLVRKACNFSGSGMKAAVAALVKSGAVAEASVALSGKQCRGLRPLAPPAVRDAA